MFSDQKFPTHFLCFSWGAHIVTRLSPAPCDKAVRLRVHRSGQTCICAFEASKSTAVDFDTTRAHGPDAKPFQGTVSFNCTVTCSQGGTWRKQKTEACSPRPVRQKKRQVFRLSRRLVFRLWHQVDTSVSEKHVLPFFRVELNPLKPSGHYIYHPF
jgi:hypothetical protein